MVLHDAMFERFAAPARRALVEAQAEARDLGHHAIGTQHLVLGLLTPDPGVNEPTRAMLLAAGLDLAQARVMVAEADGRAFSAPIIGTIPFTPRSKKVLEMSFREALGLGSNDIHPHHLLLGILREGSGQGCRLLATHDVTYEAVRAWVAAPAMVHPGARSRLHEMGGGQMGGIQSGGTIPMTPGGRQATVLAQRAAGGSGQVMATHHLLLGLIDESEGVAAIVLRALGVNRAEVEAKIAELGPIGTSDAPPVTHVKVGDSVEVRIDDPALARRLEQADAGDVGEVVRRALLEHLRPEA